MAHLTKGNLRYDYEETLDKAGLILTKVMPYKTRKDQIEEINIPDTINGMPIVEIGEDAVKSFGKLRTLHIPDSVAAIRKAAFAYCPLQTFNIPNCIQYIGDRTFEDNDIKGVFEFPPSLRHIGENAFGLDYFYDITPEEITLIFNEGLDYIGAHAFYNRKINNVVKIPKSVNFLSGTAFSYNYNFSVTSHVVMAIEWEDDNGAKHTAQRGTDPMPHWKKTTSISKNVYIGPVDNIKYEYEIIRNECTITKASPKDPINFCAACLVPAYIGGYPVKIIGARAFKPFMKYTGTKGELTSITFQEPLEVIHHEALRFLTSLSDVTLPNTLKKIGTYAFLGCRAIEKIKLPENLEEIGARAFWMCSRLKQIEGGLPSKSLKRLGQGAFDDSAITLLEIPACVKEMGGHQMFLDEWDIVKKRSICPTLRIEQEGETFCFKFDTTVEPYANPGQPRKSMAKIGETIVLPNGTKITPYCDSAIEIHNGVLDLKKSTCWVAVKNQVAGWHNDYAEAIRLVEAAEAKS